jgi:ribose 5-phosphate isomerase A
MNQDELKALVGQAALQYVVPGQIVGVGTGSTVNKFIEALASKKDQIKGAVSSSEASTARLKALGIPVLDSNEVAELAVYIDGADEINGQGHMVKGGGAALTREKLLRRSLRYLFALPTNLNWFQCWALFLCLWRSSPCPARASWRSLQAWAGKLKCA